MSGTIFAVEDQDFGSSTWPPKNNFSKAVFIGGALMGMVSSTSSISIPKDVLYPVELTNTGFQTSPRAKDMIRKIRLRSGLTWEKLSTILKVSRRSLHAWADGAEIKSENFIHLEAVYQTISKIDQGDASVNRALLLAPLQGRMPIQLLRDSQFSELIDLVKSTERENPRRKELANKEKVARAPFSPENILDAIQEPVHKPLSSKRMSMRTRKS